MSIGHGSCSPCSLWWSWRLAMFFRWRTAIRHFDYFRRASSASFIRLSVIIPRRRSRFPWRGRRRFRRATIRTCGISLKIFRSPRVFRCRSFISRPRCRSMRSRRAAIRKHAAVAVTQGALQRLNKTELQGVLAHELSHVGNRDILVSTVAAILAGIIALIADIFLRSLFFGGMGRGRGQEQRGERDIFSSSRSCFPSSRRSARCLSSLRSRAGARRWPTRRACFSRAIPKAYLRAPEDRRWTMFPWRPRRIPRRICGSIIRSKETQTSWWHKLFMTHPPIEERIKALQQMSA